MQNVFTNPANGATYTWHSNHETEDAGGKTRSIQHSAPTGGVGLVRQQGDDTPYVMTLHGKIRQRAQFQAFWLWYELCQTQTIYFTDFDGQEYEVQITSFQVNRVRKLGHTGDASVTYHYWEYTMTLEVYRFITGDLQTVGLTP